MKPFSSSTRHWLCFASHLQYVTIRHACGLDRAANLVVLLKQTPQFAYKVDLGSRHGISSCAKSVPVTAMRCSFAPAAPQTNNQSTEFSLLSESKEAS